MDRKVNQTPFRISTQFRWLVLIGTLSVFVTGCRGCSWFGSQQANTKKMTAAEKKKQEENRLRLVVRDLQMSPAQDGQAVNSLKPGHWYQGKQEVKANQNDESLDITTEMVDRRLDPIPIRGSSIIVRFKREAALAKGQSKSPEMMLHVPEMPAELDENGMPTKPTVRMLFAQRGLGAPLAEIPVPANLARPEQYSVVVFAKDTTRHNFWAGLSCMVWPTTELVDDEQKTAPHRVTAVRESEAVSTFPNSALMWTATSHLVWYDSDPALVNELQQKALLDWIHMGGQLILSGPDCLSAITNSFLSPYVPIHQIESSTLSESITDPFAKAWRLKNEPIENDFRLPTNRQVPSIRGELTENSQWVDGCESMVATRAVGNGSVTMTTFPLSDDAFVRWPGFSSFVNGALLNHPGRVWVRKDQFEGGMNWIAAYRGREGDSELSTKFRTLTRDGKVYALPVINRPVRDASKADESTTAKENKDSTSNLAGSGPGTDAVPEATSVQSSQRSVRSARTGTVPNASLFEAQTGSRSRSVGSWNDASPISAGAIESLTAASGITVPKIGLIVRLLVGYLIVLVPLNWVVFRLMGRVELAWVAVPVLAILGAGLVAKSVQLDIGFSRSESRVTCIEMFEGYPRVHQTSYVSLYTSLSESYKALFLEGDGVILPAVTGTTSAARARRESQVLDYQYAGEEGNGLSSFPVRSNSTGLLHSEEWVDLGGTFRAKIDETNGTIDLENGTPYRFKDVGVCGINLEGDWKVGWAGDMNSKAKNQVRMAIGDVRSRWFSEWDSQPFTKKFDTVLTVDGRSSLVDQENSQLSVGQMLNAAIQSIEFKPGKYVALGWLEEAIGNLKVIPQASQQNRRTMVVVHLSQGKSRPVGPDLSLPAKTVDPEPAINNGESK